MSKVIYSMSVSLDGFVATPDGSLDFVHVDDELHTFFNDEARSLGTMLHGRRMYELMVSFGRAPTRIQVRFNSAALVGTLTLPTTLN